MKGGRAPGGGPGTGNTGIKACWRTRGVADQVARVAIAAAFHGYQRREQRMAVDERETALAAASIKHVRRRCVVDGAEAQAVGHEDHERCEAPRRRADGAPSGSGPCRRAPTRKHGDGKRVTASMTAMNLTRHWRNFPLAGPGMLSRLQIKLTDRLVTTGHFPAAASRLFPGEQGKDRLPHRRKEVMCR